MAVQYVCGLLTKTNAGFGPARGGSTSHFLAVMIFKLLSM